MRFGGPVSNYSNSEEWVNNLKSLGYSAAYCPVNNKASDDLIKEYEDAVARANIVVAEVGVWNNPLSRNEEERKKAISYCKEQLYLAEKIGARCCVNISGSRGEQWDGPHKDNLTEDTFNLIVDTVREIIDAVKPKRTFYALEPMPWMYPDDADSYLRLIKAIDRKEFGVHIDMVNVISSPQKYFNNGAIIKEWFEKLGPYIKSCHAKDIILRGKLTVHLDECIPGTGGLDYVTLLKEMNKLPKDTPLMLEHLSTQEEYLKAAWNVRDIANSCGVKLL